MWCIIRVAKVSHGRLTQSDQKHTMGFVQKPADLLSAGIPPERVMESKLIRKTSCRREQASQYRRHHLAARVADVLHSWRGLELEQLAEIVRIRSNDETITDAEVAAHIPKGYKAVQDEAAPLKAEVVKSVFDELGVTLNQVQTYTRRVAALKLKGMLHITRNNGVYNTHFYVGAGRVDGSTCQTFSAALVSADRLERKHAPSRLLVLNRPTITEYIAANEVAEKLCTVVGRRLEKHMGIEIDHYERLRMETGGIL